MHLPAQKDEASNAGAKDASPPLEEVLVWDVQRKPLQASSLQVLLEHRASGAELRVHAGADAELCVHPGT